MTVEKSYCSIGESNKVERPHIDDIVDWYTASQQQLSHSAHDRIKQNQISKKQNSTGPEP